MPELPEVETMVRGVRPEVLGRRILRTEFCRCLRKPISTSPPVAEFSRRTRGQLILDVRRLAKRVVIEVGSHPESPAASRRFIVIEPRMTGLVLVSAPPTLEHRRVCWHLEPADGRVAQLEFWDRRGLGTVTLTDTDGFRTLTQRLGNDALEMDLPDWRQVLAQTSREIKVALLDQKMVAGIGNLYASEILHLARISPFRSAAGLPAAAIARLHKSVQAVLIDAIHHEGSTLGDGTYRNALNQAGDYQNHHRVYQRAGEQCPNCTRGKIERAVQAQRATFFCRKCQK